MQPRSLLINCLLYMFSVTTYASTTQYLTFKVDVYRDAKCIKSAGPAIIIDTSKSCSSYSYIDLEGRTITGSQNHVRCYKDKVVFDRYSFSGKCLASESYYQGKQIIQKNHRIFAGKCQEASSHDGPVYEKLSGYIYPQHENCKQ